MTARAAARSVTRGTVASVTLAAVAAAGAAAAVVLSRADPQERPELQRVLVQLVTGPARVAPGATVYLSGPHGEWTSAAGLANVETAEPMTAGARMRLQSVSKAWTATLVLQLAGEGRLRLDDPVERHLPGALPDGRRITLRQLLSHTSGLIDNNDIAVDAERYIDQVRDPSLRSELLRVKRQVEADRTSEFSPRLWIRFAAALPLQSEPGTEYHYSNIGYELAGAVAEEVTGEPLGALVRRRIVEPLRLESAAYDPQGEIAGPHARGYAIPDLVDTTDYESGSGAAGGIVANARDEAGFLVALMQGELLPAEQLAAMKTPPREIGSSYALGLVVAETPCGEAFTHNGGGAGYKTSVLVSGDGSRVAVLLLNGNTRDDRADAAAYAAAERLYCAA